MNGQRPVKVKHVIVAMHATLVLLAYLWARGLPSLDGPIPPWTRYTQDAWVILGSVAVIGLFLNRKWGKWLGIVFYSIVASRMLFIAVLFFAEGNIFYDYEVFLELVLISFLLCFPLALLLDIKLPRLKGAT